MWGKKEEEKRRMEKLKKKHNQKTPVTWNDTMDTVLIEERTSQTFSKQRKSSL